MKKKKQTAHHRPQRHGHQKQINKDQRQVIGIKKENKKDNEKLMPMKDVYFLCSLYNYILRGRMNYCLSFF